MIWGNTTLEKSIVCKIRISRNPTLENSKCWEMQLWKIDCLQNPYFEKPNFWEFKMLGTAILEKSNCCKVQTSSKHLFGTIPGLHVAWDRGLFHQRHMVPPRWNNAWGVAWDRGLFHQRHIVPPRWNNSAWGGTEPMVWHIVIRRLKLGVEAARRLEPSLVPPTSYGNATVEQCLGCTSVWACSF